MVSLPVAPYVLLPKPDYCSQIEEHLRNGNLSEAVRLSRISRRRSPLLWKSDDNLAYIIDALEQGVVFYFNGNFDSENPHGLIDIEPAKKSIRNFKEVVDKYIPRQHQEIIAVGFITFFPSKKIYEGSDTLINRLYGGKIYIPTDRFEKDEFQELSVNVVSGGNLLIHFNLPDKHSDEDNI